MLLNDAIQRAAKFIDKRKEAPPILRALRFIPACRGQRARVCAANSTMGIIVEVDQELPNMALPAGPLVKLSRNVVAIKQAEDKGNATALITVLGKADRTQSEYTLAGLAPSEFPGFPAIPEKLHKLSPYQWLAIEKVIHAAGKDLDKPELMNVSFRPTAVEATDHARVARAEVVGHWAGLVPVMLFKHWPKSGMVEYDFGPHHCFWRVGGEIRFAFIQKSDRYPVLDKLIPENHEGWWNTQNVRVLGETVKKAADLSPTASVVLDFGIMGLTVRAHAREGEGFEAKLGGALGIPSGRNMQYTQLLLDGKKLCEALKVMDTPKVRLCYGSVEEPLRLEAGRHIECLWPMRF